VDIMAKCGLDGIADMAGNVSVIPAKLQWPPRCHSVGGDIT